MKIIYVSLLSLLFYSCNLIQNNAELPSVPLLYYSFNGGVENTGIESFKTSGTQYVGFTAGISDSCFDLSTNALVRSPIIIDTHKKMQLNNYGGFSTIIWVRQHKGSINQYAIIGNKSINANNEKGWLISSTSDGSWQFDISNGIENWQYKGTPSRQSINDGEWHQLAFVANKSHKEIRLYYDGDNVGVLSTNDLYNYSGAYNIHIGCTPNSLNYSKDSFYGLIDEFGLWAKILSPSEIQSSYLKFTGEHRLNRKRYPKKEFKLLNWNIWNGGTQRGNEAGLDKIVSMIKDSKADFVSIQETAQSGAYLADKLDYFYYQRSNTLSFLSKYPIEETFHLYRSENLGVAKVKISDNQNIYFCPLSLSKTPNIRGLLMNHQSNIDTIVARENTSRGNEANFILNELKQLSNRSTERDAFILAGDLNSGSHLDWTADNRDNKNGLVIPFPATMSFENMGYTDAFREIYPDETSVSGITYSPIFTEGYQDRLDYVFYKGTSIKPIRAEIIDKSNSFFPSKRAALLVTFEIHQQ